MARTRLTSTPKLPLAASSRAGEQVQLATYAKGFAVSRQALINDSTGSLGTIAAGMGRAAAETQNQALVSLLDAGKRARPDNERRQPDCSKQRARQRRRVAAALSAAQRSPLAFRQCGCKKGLTGKPRSTRTPRYLLCGPSIELAARGKRSRAFFPPAQSAVQPYTVEHVDRSPVWDRQPLVSVQPIPPCCTCFEHSPPCQCTRAADRKPARVGIGSALEWRVVLDFTSAAVEWRGAYTNAGA